MKVAKNFPKWVENTVGKGEMAFPTGFQKTYTADTSKPGLVLERINPLPDMPKLGSSNSAANKDMMSKILINGDTIF